MAEDKNLHILPAAGGSAPPNAPPHTATGDDPDPVLTRIRAFTHPIMEAGLDFGPVCSTKYARVMAHRDELERELIVRGTQIAARIGPMLRLEKGESDGWQ